MALEILNKGNEEVWLEAYFVGDLSEEEVAAFEAYMLTRPHLLSRIETETSLREAFVALADRTSTPAALASRTHLGRSSGRARAEGDAGHAVRRGFWMSGIAAAFILGLSGGWLVAPMVRNPAPDIEGDFTRVIFETVRGDNASAHLVSDRPDARFVLVDFGVPDDATGIRVVFGADAALNLTAVDGFASVVMTRSRFEALHSAVLSYDVRGDRRERSINMHPIPQ